MHGGSKAHFCWKMQNTEKIVVVRPVPSRPHSSYQSFSELLAGAINTPQLTAGTTVAIKPKTLRFKPSVKHSPYDVVLSQVSGKKIRS